MTALRGFQSFQMFQSFKTFKTRTHHEGTKDTKGSEIYTLKLRALRVLRGEFPFCFFGCGSMAPDYRAFSAKVQSRTTDGLTPVLSFALNVPTAIHSSATASGTVKSGLYWSRYTA